ncbi:MAG TPA: M23 family metallopeptidase [Stellaceae bacterium]|nr:M23 family metallopeptidase [Stellaceae bacterium]
MRRLAIAAALCLVATAALAGNLTLDGTLTQGALIRGFAGPGAQVTFDGKKVRIAPDGHFIFGFGRDAPPHASLDVTFRDGAHLHRTLAIAPRHYDVRRINNLPPAEVTPPPETLVRIKQEAAEIDRAFAQQSDSVAFETPLEWPVTGIITGVYGSQTFLNGQARQPHLGVDITAPAGTPIKAAAAGTVTLAESGLYFTGGTVIIDHGYGLSTLYIHLQNIAVRAGDRVTQGEIIGALGATGRATGPNLHWGLVWNEVRLDPALAVGPMPQPNGSSPATAGAARTIAPAAAAPIAPPSH